MPFFAAVSVHDFPAAMVWESNPPTFDVDVCGNGSLFTHTTVSPAFTASVDGSKRDPSIVTVWVVGGAATALGVHRHTVRARIGLAQTLLGTDLASFAARADLWAALQVAAVRQ